MTVGHDGPISWRDSYGFAHAGGDDGRLGVAMMESGHW
jgi:hypothetical protein